MSLPPILTRTLIVLSTALFALSTAACHPWGMRLLTLEVRKGGEVVYESSFDVRDDKGTAAIWDEAGENLFADGLSAPGAFTFPEDTRAHLDGEVDLRIAHGDMTLSEVSLEGLDLIRSGDSTTDWRLPREEILRAKAAAGL
ncbi:MAG: hypothetical protein P8R43_00810 [Planctomycetota bacterium]|nr:hypothetical protein [Planctomycetota bacterium]